MDRNSIFGIILIAGILIIWGVIQSPSKKDLEKRQRLADSIAMIRQEAPPVEPATEPASVVQKTETTVSDTNESNKLQAELGEFYSVATGENKFYILENDQIRLTVSAKGGRPYRVELKNYKTFTRKPVILFDGDSTRFGLTFFSQNKPISTNELYFTAVDSTPVKQVTEGTDSLIMRLAVSEGRFIEYRYAMEPGSYMVNFSIQLVGMNDIVTRDPSALDINWEIYAPQHEQLKKNENQYTSIHYRYPGEDAEFLKPNKQTQQENIATQVQWIAFKNQFFSSVLIADASFSNALLKMTPMGDSSKYLKYFAAEMGLPFKRIENETINLKMFFGPNKFNLLKKYKGYKMEELVSVGKSIIRWINQFVIIPIFDWLSRFIGNYGLIILLLTIIIKIGLLPLTYRSYLSTARMKVLKPQIDELNQKFPKGKELEKQQATMALYKKAGVSPMGGCLPMLLQFPILFAMFKFFPTSIELRQEAFLWAKDLSTYDAIITWQQNIPLLGDHISLFTVLMTVSTILSMKLSDTAASSQQVPGMKTMMYIMPVMFLFALNNFSSGLTYYYFLANVITIGQNYLFKWFIDEDEILRKIEEKKSKPVKKSKFQQRLEEMAKQSGYRTSTKPAKKK